MVLFTILFVISQQVALAVGDASDIHKEASIKKLEKLVSYYEYKQNVIISYITCIFIIIHYPFQVSW